MGVIDRLDRLLIGRCGGLSNGLFADIEETAFFADEESIVAVVCVGLDAYLVCQLLLHSDLYEFWRGFLGLAVNVVVLRLF